VKNQDGVDGVYKEDLARSIRGGIGGGPVSHLPFRPIGGEPFSHHRVGDPTFGENRKVSTHARKGTPPHARDEGFLEDLRSAEWPAASGVKETKAEKKMRTAKLRNHTYGEDAGTSGDFGNMVKSKGDFGNMVKSKGDFGNMVKFKGDFGNMVKFKGDFGNMVKFKGDFGNMVKSKGDFGNMVKSKGDLGNMVKSKGDFGNMVKSKGDYGEFSSDSDECLKTFGYYDTRSCSSSTCSGRDHLNLLMAEAGMERFVGAVAKEELDSKVKIVEAVVDSGAEESVAPPGCFANAVSPSRMSKAGGKYRAANGARIPNLGQQRVPFTNDDGGKCGIVFQVAEVERPLISATQLAASGNAVIIDGKGARIVNSKTRRVMNLVKRGGVYVLRMRVKADPAPGFPGPGR
jgi:hypothetical protein